LGTYPKDRAVSLTHLIVSIFTRPFAFNALDATLTDTPASFATSRIVGLAIKTFHFDPEETFLQKRFF
jgi:hypothetical protein